MKRTAFFIVLFAVQLAFISHAREANDTLPGGAYHKVKCVLQHTGIDTVPLEVNIYPNIYFLYNEKEFPGMTSTINALHLSEITAFNSLFSGHLYYIAPDSVKWVQRKVNILGNFFTYSGGGAVLDRDLSIDFKEGTSKRSIDALLDRNGLKHFDPYFDDLFTSRYTNVIDMITSAGRMQKEKILKDWRYISWQEKDLSAKHVWPTRPRLKGVVSQRKKIHQDTLLFTEDGEDPYVHLYLYCVRENDSTFADTTYLLEHTLSSYTTFEFQYEAEAVVYELEGDRIIFYDQEYSFDELFGTPYQNPKLYSTRKETYVFRSSGTLVLLKSEYGMMNSKMISEEMDTEVRKYTQKKFDNLGY
jgi:hypothetical protein